MYEIFICQANDFVGTVYLDCMRNDKIREVIQKLEEYDKATYLHSVRVAKYAVLLASVTDYEDLKEVAIAGLLHDVGKVYLSKDLINKTDKLTPIEYEAIKNHVRWSTMIAHDAKVDKSVALGVFEHHERLNGQGYPLGTIGNQLSQIGKIIAVADVFDALTSNRPYREKLDLSAVKQIMANEESLDPQLVEIILRVNELDIRAVHVW